MQTICAAGVVSQELQKSIGNGHGSRLSTKEIPSLFYFLALILLLRSKTFIHVIEDTKDVHNLPHGQCKTTAHWELNLVLHRKILFHFIKQMEQL